MEIVLVLVGLAVVGFFVMKTNERDNAEANRGADQLKCPHCRKRGQVTVKVVTRGKGIGGGKATAGLMTGGLSLPFAGLSKNVTTRELTCGNCAMKWDVGE